MVIKKYGFILLVLSVIFPLYGMGDALPGDQIRDALNEIRDRVKEYSLEDLEKLYTEKTLPLASSVAFQLGGSKTLLDAAVSASGDREERIDFVAALVAKPDFNPKDEKYARIVFSAVSQADSELFKMLIDAELPLDGTHHSKVTCLIKTVDEINRHTPKEQLEKELEEQLRIVGHILDHPEGKKLINLQDRVFRETALCNISRKRVAGVRPIIDRLLDEGADPYINNMDNENAFDVQPFPKMRDHMEEKRQEYVNKTASAYLQDLSFFSNDNDNGALNQLPFGINETIAYMATGMHTQEVEEYKVRKDSTEN